MSANLNSARVVQTTVFAVLVFVAFGYSNCAKLQYDPEDNSSSVVKQSTDMIDATGACPTGRVPIGITNNKEIQCANLHTFTPYQACPTNYYLYNRTSNPDRVTCVRIWELDRVGLICPVNHYLRGFMANGDIVCEQMPGTNPNFVCDAGYYLRGFENGNTAICDALPTGEATVPNHCPQGKYLSAIENGQVVCKDIDWNAFPLTQCPSGSALVGLNAGQAVCQKLMNRTQAASGTCPAGQFALNDDNGTLTCLAKPEADLVRFCGSGYYPRAIVTNGFDCDPLPSTDTRFNGTCGPGKLLSGFSNGEAVCETLPIPGNLPSVCPNGNYPVGLSNGQLVCKFYPWLRSNPQSCTPYDTQVCAIQNGVGIRSCRSDGASWSSCVPSICNAGFELVNDQCQAITCQPGSTTACVVPHGSGMRVCKTDGSGYEAQCNVQVCNNSYRLVNNECVPLTCNPGSTASCTTQSGYGIKTCNSGGTAYGSCAVLGCLTGWTSENGSCVDKLAPRIYFLQVPPNNAMTGDVRFDVEILEHESGLAYVQCRLNSGNWGSCESPITVLNLGSGTHRFEVRATDNAGNVSTKAHQWSIQ